MNMSDNYDSENQNIHNFNVQNYQNSYKMSEKEFYELQEEYINEELYAMHNGMNSIYWCKACKIGICINPYHE
jgi:hypothetical protein